LRAAPPSLRTADLAERVARFESAVRFGSLPERQDAIDDGAQPARLHVLEDPEEAALGAHGRPEDLDLPEEDVTQIDLRLEARRGSARHDLAAGRRGQDAPGHHVAAHVLDDHVDPTLAREPLHLGDEIAGLVVDDLVGPETPRALRLGLAAGGRQHASAEQLGDLDCGARDAAARRLDEHRLPGPHLPLVDDHLPGGQKDERHRGDLREGQVAGVREQVGVRHDDVLRVAAVRVLAEDGVLPAQVVVPREALLTHAARDPRIDDDALSEAGAARAGADGLHLADHVGPEAVRVLELEAGQPATDPQIEVVEGHGPDANAHLARTGVRDVDGLADEDLGATVRAQDDGFGLHGPTSFR
jgi:hypothetical protein